MHFCIFAIKLHKGYSSPIIMSEKAIGRFSFVGICSTLHFLVDGLCVCSLYLLSSHVEISYLLGIFLTYNILAFLTQPLTGTLVDKSHKMHWILLASVVSLSLAVLLLSLVISTTLFRNVWGIFAIASFLGIGNSLFHVWGGKQTVLKTDNDIRALGTFVSTGAFGLSVGMVFFSWTLLYIILLAICLLSLAYLKLDFSTSGQPAVTTPPTDERLSFTQAFVCFSIVSLMLIVMLRSLIGELFSSGIVKNPTIILALGAVAMFGKMAGGWLCKYMGLVPASILMVVGVVVCLLFKGSSETVLFMGLFLINCTMPVTLYLANVLLRGKEGYAFGLLAASLIPGYLLSTL